jgi:hypothetical protein
MRERNGTSIFRDTKHEKLDDRKPEQRATTPEQRKKTDKTERAQVRKIGALNHYSQQKSG